MTVHNKNLLPYSNMTEIAVNLLEEQMADLVDHLSEKLGPMLQPVE